ncbi:MAG: tetratricopeptide repeat protein [Bryobacteraceae bacterium]
MKHLAIVFLAAAPSLLAGWGLPGTPSGPGLQPRFGRDIAPILYHNCVACHHPGGHAPFSLATYPDVRQHARAIASATRSRQMPPWPPAPGYGDFLGARRLTRGQIQTIAKWVRAGAPEGPASQIPTPPRFTSQWALGPPDLVVKAPHPFTVPAGGPNVFWNFVLKPDIKTTKYVRAIEIRPGPRNLIHHCNMIVDRTGSSLRLEKTPGAGGFPGLDVIVDRSVFDPIAHLLVWKPGSVPYSEPDGLAWRLDPGNYLILNTHLQPRGKPEQAQPEVGLYFTNKPPTKFPIVIPLDADSELNIPAGDHDFVVSDHIRLPEDVDVLAIYPHAHLLGKRIEAYAILPDGTRKWLILIPNWNMYWQAVYRYRKPVFLPKGSVIWMRYHYDNSSDNPRNPNHPPKRVRAGNQSTDEMAHCWLQVLPRGKGDHRRPIQEAIMRHQIKQHPNDFQAHMNLGALLLSRLDAQDAEAQLATAVRLDPKRPEAHDMLGVALENLGRSSGALLEFRIALRDDPHYLDADYNLAMALARRGQIDQAVKDFRLVAAAYPKSALLQKQLRQLLVEEKAGHK